MGEVGKNAPRLLVDGHCHVFPKGMPHSPTAWTHIDYGFPVEDYLALLDRHDIQYGVIAAASIFSDNNRYTLEVLERFNRLRATVLAGPETTKKQLQEYADAGVVGVRFQWRNLEAMPDLSDPAMTAFLHAMRDTGLHVELLARGRDMPHLLPLLEEKGVDIIIDHLGDPDVEEGVNGPGCHSVLKAVATGRTWVKVSALSRIEETLAQDVIASLIKDAGSDRLIWGSDAPFVGHEDHEDFDRALERFARVMPSANHREAAAKTAYSLFFR